MHTNIAMENFPESKPINDLEIIGEIKDRHKGARKTMPSARNCHRDVKMLKSMIISRSNTSREIYVPSVSVSDTLNTGLFPITSMSNATNPITSKLGTGELEIKSSNAENRDQHSKSQNSFKSTTEKPSNNSVSFQSKTKVLGNGRGIYNKRPLESREFLDVDSYKVHKIPCMLDRPEYGSKHDENKQRLLAEGKITGTAESSKRSNPNENFPTRKKFMTDFTNLRLAQLKSTEITKVQQEGKHPDTPRPFHKSKTNENPFPQTSKNAHVLLKEDPQFIDHQVNIDGPSSGTHHMKEIGLNQERQSSNMETMTRDNIPIMAIPARMKKVEDFDAVASMNAGVLNMPVSSVRSMHDVRSMLLMMPRFQGHEHRNLLIPPNQAVDGRSQYTMLGTASRSMNVVENQISTLSQIQGTTPGLDVFNPNYAFTVAFPQQQAINEPQNLNPEKLQNPAKLKKLRNLRKPRAIKTITRTVDRAQLQIRELKKIDNIKIKQNEVHDGISKSRIATKNLHQPDRKELSGTLAGNYGNEAKANKEQTSVETKDENKIQEAQAKVMKVVELLRDINKTFSEGFECAGLEGSLPVWRSELVQCILSIEKISKVLSEYQENKE